MVSHVLCAANLRNSTRREVSKRTVQGTAVAVEAETYSDGEEIRIVSKRRRITVGVSSGLKFYGFLSGGGNERNWEDEQEFASVIICA